MSIAAQDPTLLCNVSVHDPSEGDDDATSITDQQLLVKDLFPDPSHTHDKVKKHRTPAPEVVGNYELIKVLGQGTTGVVWQAVHLGSVQREVALKIMHADRHDQHALIRFAGEVRALTALDHPNIAKVWEYGSTPFDQPYLVMELIVGQSLIKHADTWSLPLYERIRLMIAVCRGVQHAHQRGILHRDLKPANILVTFQDGIATPKVIDFGLAKSLCGPLVPEQVETTQRGCLLGTIGYMSPEQADLDQDKVDTRSDVHALSAVLYELLTGTLPIPKEELHRRNLSNALDLIRTREAELPSRRVARVDDEICQSARCQLYPGQLREKLKGDLDAILLKGLAKDPAQRYQTADELAKDLERYLSGGIVQARRQTYWYLGQKLIRNHWKMVSLVAAFALTIVLGLIGTTWALLWALEERNNAVNATVNMGKAREKERESKENAELYGAFLSDVLAFVKPMGEEGRGRQTTLLEALDATTDTLSERFVGHPRAESLARLALARSYLKLGRTLHAQQHIKVALELMDSAQDESFQPYLQGKMLQIEAHTAMNELEPAEQECRALLDQVNTDQRITAASKRRLRNLLKNIFVEKHKYVQAEQLLLDMAAADRLSKKSIPLNEDARAALIILYFSWGEQDPAKWSAADDLIHELQQERDVGYDHFQLLNLRAFLLRTQHQYKRAERVYQEILDNLPPNQGLDDHVFHLTVRYNHALNLHDLGRENEAEQQLDKVWQTQKTALGASHQLTITTLQSIVHFYEDRGVYEQADKVLTYLDDLISGQAEAFGPTHPFVIRTHLHRASLLAISKRWDQCKEKAHGICELVEAQPSPDDAILAQAKAIYALAELETGAPQNAEKLMDAANVIARTTNRADIVALVQNQTGWFLHRRAHRSDEAGYLLLTSLQNVPHERLYLETGMHRLIQFYQDVGNVQQRDQWLWNLAEMQWPK
jgi:serine/threonine protein kinase